MNKKACKNFDLTYDSQKVFSVILKAFSFPGKLFKIPEIDYPFKNINQKFIASFGLALLDFETTFFVIDSENDSFFKDYIIKNTQSEYADMSEADFIFVINSLLSDSIRIIKKGSLNNPSKSATVIYLIEGMDEQLSDSEESFKLTGPGIKDRKYLRLNNFNSNEINNWILANKDFPLGIDIVLISKNGEIAAIPRSIKIEANF